MFISTETPKQQGAIEIFKTLRGLIELRKRNAFDSLKPIIDLENYPEELQKKIFNNNDNDFGFDIDLTDTAELKNYHNWGNLTENIRGFDLNEEGTLCNYQNMSIKKKKDLSWI